MSLLTFFSKVTRLLRSMVTPYQFVFVQCHSYLDNKRLVQIKSVLESRDEAEKMRIILEYEANFAKLVGAGFASSFASGRMAFYALMEALGIGNGDEVILTGFTCSVMPNAVMKRGASPVYADMDEVTFGSSASAIQKVITSKTKLIVAQHSFGIPCDIDQIVILAKKKGIFVVEDCAITLDSSLNGIKVGNWGDAAIFSTDHSKPLNTIIGGIFYTRNLVVHEQVALLARKSLPLAEEHQQSLYQQMLFERKHYIPTRYPRARIFSYALKMWSRILGISNTTFLEDNYTRPSSRKESYPYPAAMPAFLAMLGTLELERWSEQKVCRKELLQRMVEKFRQSSYSAWLSAVYNDPTRDIVPLRFVFTCADTEALLQGLSKFIDVNWIWFRQPVAGAVEGLNSLHYLSDSCPVSEVVCSTIINLPCNIVAGSDYQLLHGFDEIFG
jgi:perosamine synthetase